MTTPNYDPYVKIACMKNPSANNTTTTKPIQVYKPPQPPQVDEPTQTTKNTTQDINFTIVSKQNPTDTNLSPDACDISYPYLTMIKIVTDYSYFNTQEYRDKYNTYFKDKFDDNYCKKECADLPNCIAFSNKKFKVAIVIIKNVGFIKMIQTIKRLKLKIWV